MYSSAAQLIQLLPLTVCPTHLHPLQSPPYPALQCQGISSQAVSHLSYPNVLKIFGICTLKIFRKLTSFIFGSHNTTIPKYIITFHSSRVPANHQSSIFLNENISDLVHCVYIFHTHPPPYWAGQCT